MDIRDLFFNRHDEIRSGWRVMMFLAGLFGLSLMLLTPVYALGLSQRFLPLVAVIGATVMMSFVMTRYLHRKPLTAIGLSLHPGMPRELAVGALLGLGLMSGIAAVELSAGWHSLSSCGLSTLDLAGTASLAAVEFLLAAALEELLFRGYLFQVLIQGITLLPATLMTALLFTFAHGWNPNVGPLAFLNIGLASILLAAGYYRTRSLWFPIALHFAWNFSQTTLFAFSTSGFGITGRSLFSATQTGPDWVTGGSFGPEGGALATAALLAGLWFVLKTRHLHTPSGIVTLDSVEDLLPPAGPLVTGAS